MPAALSAPWALTDMDYLIVCIAALSASALTLFSGFGLGTLLMPVIALFFPLELAIAMTAVVHLANNVFKFGLFGRYADRAVLLRFGLPAVIGALAGAALLGWLGAIAPIATWYAYGHAFEVSPIKLVVGMLIIGFVALEGSERVAAVAFAPKWLPLGGVTSGFFGGLSGHQGALRSLFLLKAGLDKNAFIATGVLLALMIDVTRIAVYGETLAAERYAIDWALVAAASLSAFLGAYLGSRLLEKVTLRAVKAVVATLLVVIAVGMIVGVL